jgi:hypothetical protein
MISKVYVDSVPAIAPQRTNRHWAYRVQTVTFILCIACAKAFSTCYVSTSDLTWKIQRLREVR